jgi:hypothetical protein
VLYSIYSDVPTELRLVRSDGTGDKSLVRLTWPGGTPTSLGQTSWEATNVWPVDDRLPAKPEPAQSCSFERTPADGYYSYVDITGNSGCLRVFPNVRLELDQPANGRDLSFGSDGSLRRLTQAHMTVVDAASAEACPAEFSSAGSWPDLIRLEGLGTNRLCVITNGGGVVELRFDPYYPAEGPLVIHYRTVGAPAR